MLYWEYSHNYSIITSGLEKLRKLLLEITPVSWIYQKIAIYKNNISFLVNFFTSS